MSTETLSKNGEKSRSQEVFRMDPLKFNLWIFMVTVVMTFAGLTSAYIVRRADGDWWSFPLPEAFLVTSLIVIISSFTMHLATKAAQNDDLFKLKTALWTTLILGLGFAIGQFYGWGWLVENGIYLSGNPNPAGSFLYVLSGLHWLHILGAILFILVTLVAAHRNKINSKNTRKLELCATFWHFLGGLWIYLYLFLLLFR